MLARSFVLTGHVLHDFCGSNSDRQADHTEMLRNVQPADLVYSLLNQLKDPATSLSEKYQILFSLRNIQGPEAQAALTEGGTCSQS